MTAAVDLAARSWIGSVAWVVAVRRLGRPSDAAQSAADGAAVWLSRGPYLVAEPDRRGRHLAQHPELSVLALALAAVP